MATTPEASKGVPRHEGNSVFTPRADHNALADWVRDNLGRAATNAAALPTSPDFPGQIVMAQDTGDLHVRTSAGTWGVLPVKTVVGTPVIGAGWNTPSNLSLVKRSGFCIFRFNAARASASAVGADIATIPAGFQTNQPVWCFAWGLNGAPVATQVYYDETANVVRLNQGLSTGHSIALTFIWQSTD